MANTLRNSNYTKAFPNVLSGCDWIEVSEKNWPEKLKTGAELTFRTKPEQAYSPILYHLYFEQQNQRKRPNQKILALGFPLVFCRTEGSIQAFPVFIWPIKLRPFQREQDHWQIKSDADLLPFINPSLLEKLTVPSAPIQARKWLSMEQPFPSLAQLLGLTKAEFEADDWQIYPDFSSLEDLQDPPLLYPGAILGLFPGLYPKQVPLPSIDRLPIGKADISWRHHISHQDLDPSQQAALNHFYESEITLVNGAAGTGKTHLVENLIVNALSNHKRILLISKRPSTFQRIQQNLENLGLSYLSYWLQNPKSDAKILPQILQSPIQASSTWSGEQALRSWLRKADEFQQFKDRQDNAFRAARTPIFGPMDWAQTLGLFLQSTKQGERAILGIQLNTQDFTLDLNEFKTISEQLEKGQQLFQQIGSIRHPLQRLHPSIFVRYGKAEAEKFVRTKLDFFLRRLEQLQQSHINLINQYERQLKAFLERFFKQFTERITDIENQIENNITAYGNDFLLTSTISLKIYAPFSKRIKAIKEEKEKILQQTKVLHQELPQMPDLVYPPLPQPIGRLKQLQSWLTDLQNVLVEWHDQIPELLQDHLRRLNYQTTYDKLDSKPKILQLEAALDQTVEALNNVPLLQEKQTQPMLTLPKRQQRIESLIEYLEIIQINLRDFAVFYDWQLYWLHQDKRNQEIIQSIIRSKSKHWQPTFEAWYLQQLLESRQSTHLPERTYPYAEHIENLKVLQTNLSEQIKYQWEANRQENARQLKRSLDHKKEIKEEDFLRKLLSESGKHFTQLLPLLMATPEQAETLLKETRQSIFDLVIFESAQFIDGQRGQFIQQFGKQSFIIGQQQLDIDKKQTDLLSVSISAGLPKFELAFFHQYFPGHLWQLMHGQNITEKALQPFKLDIHSVKGSYNEGLGINTDEVYHIMEYLKSRKRDKNRVYPSLAIVCNTLNQRNFISKAILDLKRKGSGKDRDNMLQMERNGLMVLHLDELASFRFEEMLYSFTFSVDFSSGEISSQAERLNQATSLQQLYELMSLGKSSIQILHSLSIDWLNQQLENKEQPGYFLFANYLKILQAIDQGNADTQGIISKRIKAYFDEPEAKPPFTPLYDEIASRLPYFLPGVQIQRHFQEADLHFPLIVRHDDYPHQRVAILIDYFVSNFQATQILWEEEQRNIFSRRKIHCMPTYSLAWWRNPNHAAQTLANLIVETWEK